MKGWQVIAMLLSFRKYGNREKDGRSMFTFWKAVFNDEGQKIGPIRDAVQMATEVMTMDYEVHWLCRMGRAVAATPVLLQRLLVWPELPRQDGA